jgi:hypothetical protein
MKNKNEALKTFQGIVAFGKRYKDIGCQVCKVLSRTISGGVGGGVVRKSVQWDLFPEPDCFTSIRSAQLRIILFSQKQEWLEKAQNVLYYV